MTSICDVCVCVLLILNLYKICHTIPILQSKMQFVLRSFVANTTLVLCLQSGFHVLCRRIRFNQKKRQFQIRSIIYTWSKKNLLSWIFIKSQNKRKFPPSWKMRIHFLQRNIRSFFRRKIRKWDIKDCIHDR